MPGRPTLSKSPTIRMLLIVVGWASIILGVIGKFLPLLPTTPFLLLAAGCFARSSPRFHHWLLNHPQLGPIIHLYLDGKGIPKAAKVYILLTLWATISISMFFVPLPWVKVLLPCIALAVTLHILRMPTLVLPRSDLSD